MGAEAVIDRTKLLEAVPYATDRQAEVIQEYLTHETDAGIRTAATFGVHPATVSRSLGAALGRLDRQRHNSPEGFEAAKVSTNGKGDVVAVRHRPVQDQPEDQRTPGFAIQGISTLYNDVGGVSAKWVKEKAAVADQWRAFEEAAETVAEKYVGLGGQTVGPDARTMSSVRAYYVLGDMHVGLLAWANETGTNMDLKTIVALGIEATSALVARTMPTEEAVLVNVGDFFHADDNTNRTPNGKNVLDVDSRFGKVAEAGMGLMVNMITILRQKHDRVRVVTARGNHDPHLSIALYLYLKAFYSKDPNVIVEEPYKPLQTFVFGKNLVGVTHGDGLKMDKIPEVITVQCRQEWAGVEYAIVLTGHIHHKTKIERGGVVVESFNTLNSGDHWHAAHGFTGSGRWFESVVLAEAGGECARSRVTVNSKGDVV
jgi:predicted phosphodiesterase